MHTLELGDKVMEGNIRALKKVRTVAFLLDDFAFKALSTLILAPCSFMFCFHGCSLLTLILIKLTVTLVACCVTKCQEKPIRLAQIWRSVFLY